MRDLAPRPRTDDRTWEFLLQQYKLAADRVTMLEVERERWIRLSILATFGFLGWIVQNAESTAMDLMLGTVELRAITLFPLVFNLGGALRFLFIQRDVNRLMRCQAALEAGPLAIPGAASAAYEGSGLRDRHRHLPSLFYWAAILLLCAAFALFLTVDGAFA